ncbi:MAG: DUF2029 domain-containing protein [Candidatus Lokiarchaeota archaeon]|nr:DUF2029 domain-containing protein [Candidatus Lokiarchaeota archaeon]
MATRQQRIVDAAGRNARRLFVLAIACNAVFITIAIVYHLFFNPALHGDLRWTWLPAVDSWLNDPNSLYDNVLCPFKNPPQLVYLLMAFYFLPGDLLAKIFAFSLSVLATSLASFVVARRNYRLMGHDATMALLLASLGLVMTAQGADHVYSQFNVAAGLCVVLSFYGMLVGNEKLQFFFLGLSVMFKHITIFMIPIVLLQGRFKIGKLIRRLFFMVLPLVPSVAMLLAYPHLISSLVRANTSAIVDYNNSIAFAGSLTKFLALYAPLSPLAALVVVAAVGYGAFVVLWRKRCLDGQDFYIAGAFVTMLVSPEFYGQHHGIFYFIIVAWAIKYNKRYARAKFVLVALVSTIFVIPLSSVFFLSLYMLEKLRASPPDPILAPTAGQELPAAAAGHP